MRRIAHAAADRLVDALIQLPNKPVAQRASSRELAALVDEALPTQGHALGDCLDFFFTRVEPRMTRVNHPRFHAYIPCPGSFAGMLGDWLAAATNPFLGSWLGGATLASLELTVLRWIAELVGYPAHAGGILTSGGSMANLTGLAAARARVGTSDALARGTLYVSNEGHASMDKAATLLGFLPSALRRVPVDARMRMRPDALAELIRADRNAGRHPLLVCANAGTTNTGAIDPLEAIADLCQQEALWLHVDGAYGGFAAVADEGRRRLAGMERADSLTLDPHKWLWAPMGVGCALVRDASALEAAFAAHGDYLQDLPADEINFLSRGPELSRPARVLPVWMVIRTIGREGLAAQVEADLHLAQLAADLLSADGRFELVDPPQLSVVAFRHRGREGEDESARAARDRQLMERTLADGTCMLSTTVTGGRSALRLVVMNHRSSEADVRLSVSKVRELAC